MIPDLALLLIFFSDRNLWDLYHQSVKITAVSPEVRLILSDLEEYYLRGLDSGGKVELAHFATWFHQIQHPEFNETKHQLYNELFKRVTEQTVEINQEYMGELLGHLKSQAAKTAIQTYLDSNEKWNPAVINDIVKDFDAGGSITDKRLLFSDPEPKVFLERVKRQNGLQWPLKCLRNSIGPIIRGDFGLVAAYVETGKTAWMATVAVHMATQVTEGSVLFFNNEGTNEDLQSRLWSIALKKTKAEILEDLEQSREDYTQIMNGDISRIKIIYSDGWKPSDVRFVVQHYKPALVLIDMADKFSSDSGSDASEHTRCAQIYRSLRGIANEFCPVIISSQVDATGSYVDSETGEEEFKAYIPMRALRESKVDKQGEMSFLITIGKNTRYPSTRYIHVAKNKLDGVGNPAFRYMKSEVKYNEKYGLYED